MSEYQYHMGQMIERQLEKLNSSLAGINISLKTIADSMIKQEDLARQQVEFMSNMSKASDESVGELKKVSGKVQANNTYYWDHWSQMPISFQQLRS